MRPRCREKRRCFPPVIYILCVRGSGCLTLKLSTPFSSPPAARKRSISTVSRLSPDHFFLHSLLVFIALLPSTVNRQLPDYDQHREPITRSPVFISIIHRGFAPFNAPPPLFLKLPPAAAATRPHLELPWIYITRNSANRPISLDPFQQTLFLGLPRS